MNTIRTELRLGTKAYPKHQVLVFEYKFDNIRQESYWVCTTVREYRLLSDAQTFKARYE